MSNERPNRLTPDERYLRDPMFHNLVDQLRAALRGGELTIAAIRAAKLGDGGGPGQGKPSMFAGKRPGMIYLTDRTRARLKTLAANAEVSQSDFLEVLIRRYGIRAGSDILDATKGLDDGDQTPGPADGASDPM